MAVTAALAINVGALAVKNPAERLGDLLDEVSSMGIRLTIRTGSQRKRSDDRHHPGTPELGLMMMPSQGNLHRILAEDYDLIAAELREAAAAPV